MRRSARLRRRSSYFWTVHTIDIATGPHPSIAYHDMSKRCTARLASSASFCARLLQRSARPTGQGHVPPEEDGTILVRTQHVLRQRALAPLAARPEAAELDLERRGTHKLVVSLGCSPGTRTFSKYSSVSRGLQFLHTASSDGQHTRCCARSDALWFLSGVRHPRHCTVLTANFISAPTLDVATCTTRVCSPDTAG